MVIEGPDAEPGHLLDEAQTSDQVGEPRGRRGSAVKLGVVFPQTEIGPTRAASRVRAGRAGARRRPPARLRPRARRRRLRPRRLGRAVHVRAPVPRALRPVRLPGGDRPRRSSSLPACSCCRSGRPRSSRSRRPRSTSSLAGTSGSASGSAGTSSSSRRSARTSTTGASRSEEQIEVMRRSGPSRSSTSTAAGTASRGPESIRSPFSGRSRSGSAAPPRPPSSAPLAWRTESSRSGRSTATGRRRSSSSGAGPRRPAATRQIGIEWRIDVSNGTPDDWRAEVEERKQLGATHFSLATMRGGLDVKATSPASMKRAKRSHSLAVCRRRRRRRKISARRSPPRTRSMATRSSWAEVSSTAKSSRRRSSRSRSG